MHLKNDFGLKGIYFHIREPSKKWGTENANTYKEEIVNNELFFFQTLPNYQTKIDVFFQSN